MVTKRRGSASWNTRILSPERSRCPDRPQTRRCPAVAAPSFPKPPSRRLRGSPPARPGVYSLGSGPSRALGAFRDAVGSSDHAAGVRAEVGETQVAVDIDLVALYGAPLHALADQIRAAVYAAVEELVGLQVIEVNIEINESTPPARRSPVPRPRPGPKGGNPVNMTVVGIAMGAFVALCRSSSASGVPWVPCSSWGSEPCGAAPRKGNWTFAACLTPSQAGVPPHERPTAGAATPPRWPDTPGSAPRRPAWPRPPRRKPSASRRTRSGPSGRRRRAAGLVPCLTHHPPATARSQTSLPQRRRVRAREGLRPAAGGG